MPTVTLKKISKIQPMREGEIDVIDYLNGDMTDYLEQETSERKQEDANLQSELDSEIERATKAEETIQDNLDSEIDRAEQAEQTLQANIDAEKSRAEQAEQTLQANIDAEKSRATDKESELQQHIEAETDRATKAETELSSKITAETERATQTEAGIEEHIHTAEDELNSKIENLAGNGLAYDSSTDKLSVKQADAQTFGGVKLKHDVDNDTSDEWAVTSDGVYSYAPSKAETISQPTEFEFTQIQSGVTLSVQNVIRIGGLMLANIRVQCGADTTVSSNTKFATPPQSVGGVGIGASMSGVCIQISQVSIIVNKALEPNSDTYFTVVFPYKNNGGN